MTGKEIDNRCFQNYSHTSDVCALWACSVYQYWDSAKSNQDLVLSSLLYQILPMLVVLLGANFPKVGE